MRDRSLYPPGARVKIHLVDEAPAPVLAGFERLHDGVLRGTKMLRRVPIRRIVAAANVPADHAEPKMYPLRADPEAVFAAVGARGDLAYLIEMRAAPHGSTVGARRPYLPPTLALGLSALATTKSTRSPTGR